MPDGGRNQLSLASGVSYVVDEQDVIRGKVENEPEMLVYAHESLRMVRTLEGKP